MRDSNDWIFSSAADQGVAMDFAGVLGMETGVPSRDDSLSNAGACMRLRATPVDFDSALEPVTRCRANTWPCRPNDSVGDEENRSTPTSVDGDQTEGVGCRDPSLGGGVVGPCGGAGTRKAAARRNAWGNLSYADLITRAIESSPEKRLTLSQIYSWMVENVPFFKDKGDSNSSAGWKNSIRHNLSLHSRFMRVQNESTGKSSWWVINPDVKTLKTPRRRAATMDNTKVALQHRRNRLKGGGLPRVSSSDRPLMGYAYDGSPDHMDASNLDPDMLGIGSQSYRVRSSSNASSIGRLSPILATAEHDAEETQFRMSLPSSSTLSPWNGLCLPPSESCAETLSESLASIFVEDPKKSNLGGEQCHGNVMAQNGSVMTPNRAGIMAQNGGGVLGQNAGNVMSTGGGALGQNRNVMGQNGAPMMGGMPAYPHGTVGMEGRAGGHLAMGHHHMWSVYRNQQPGNVFPSSPIPGDVGNKMGVRYNGDSGYSMRHMVSRPGMGFYEESRGPRYGQFGVPGIGGAGSQYGNPALSELLKQEHKPTSCYFAGSNGDPGVGMTSPLTSCVKSEHPAMAVFPGERQGMAQWPEQQQQQQQQQQQSPRQLSLGSPLGPIDPRKLMKVLAEKPHLKEKMLQLIQQKRQQLTLQQHQHQQQVNSVSHPGSTPPSYLNATMSRLPETAQPKHEPPPTQDAVNPSKPLSAAASCRSGQETSMPVDLDLDFEANPVINCDIDQVIQHELTFGELDFSLDQLQVTVSSSSMDLGNGYRF